MVQFYRKTHEYPETPATTLLAFFLRYPNPFARHVLSVDTLSRSVNPVTGRVHTLRLILKRGIIPKWANRFLPVAGASGGRGLDAWVLEESIVDPPGSDGPRLWCEQGNLNHRKFLHVIEGGELSGSSNGGTTHHTTAEVKSNLSGMWSSMIRDKIESYGVGKFEVNAETARKGMALVLERLRNREPLPDTAEFYPPPPPSFGEAWSTKPDAPGSFFLSKESIDEA